MRKILVVLVVGLVLLLALSTVTGYCWIGDRQLELINRRIDETEARLMELDQDQLLNRLDWTDWGIDLLNRDINSMEKEIRAKREKWEKMRDANVDSEQAWREWEKAGRELDELDRKKARLDSTLERLRMLRDRIKKRIREIKEIYEPKPFSLGLGIGSLSYNSTQIAEVKLKTPWIDLFYGSDGYEEEKGERERLSYLGGEIPLGGFQITKGIMIKFPVGVEKFSFEDGITPCVGILGQTEWKNTKGETSTGFVQFRYGLGEGSITTVLIGIFF